MIAPWIAFLAWVPTSVLVFRRYPARLAVLINFIAGWMLLPSAAYPPTSTLFPYWILGTCLPANYFFTKASVTAITCLLGILLVDRAAFKRLSLSLWDLPIVVWCTVPVLTAIANPETSFIAGLRSELYQALAWGVPYLAGRLYLNNIEALELAAKSFVVAGVAYIPVCLLEIFTGPQLYAHLYGYQPYRWIGAQRYIGFRPIGFLEDGNQLGIWMATAALLAVWLWKHRLVTTILRIPIGWLGGALFVVTLLCQSGGSIVLLFCLLFFAFVRQSYLPRLLAAFVLLGIIGAIGLRLTNVISLRSLVTHNRTAYAGAQFLKRIHRGSFGWRLSQDEQHVDTALEKPLLGSGQWDWWKASGSRPWSLWLLAFGMYGIIGLLGLECLQLVPVARVLWLPFARGATQGLELRNALAAAVLMSAVDNLLNGSMILPLVLVIGGLSEPSPAVSDESRPDTITRRTTRESKLPGARLHSASRTGHANSR